MTTNNVETQLRTIRRSRGDRMLSGVCGGIARTYDMDPTLLRLAFAGLALITGGTAVLAYLVCWIVIPEEN